MSRTYELSFKLGAQMAGNFAKTMSSASGTLASLNKQISGINSQQKSIQSLQELRKKSAQLSVDLSKARENTARLSSEMKTSQQQTDSLGKQYRSAAGKLAYLSAKMAETEEPADELKNAFAQAQSEAKRLGSEFKKSQSETNRLNQSFEKSRNQAATLKQQHSENRIELQRLKQSMGGASTSTKDLISRQNQLAAAAEKARAAQAALSKTMAAQDANMAQRGELRGQLFDAAGLAVALGAPVKIAAQFEQSMAKVGAVSNATDEQLAQLTATARSLGATTSWSASQAAEGMQFLAMAGFNTQQTIAAMPGMLDLASAGATDLGTAADIASNILTGFNLKAEEMGRLGDVMVNTFTTSNTNLSMLGETMKYVAPVAAATGVSLEQAAAMAAKLGDAGIQGSNAGTALRAVISRLSAPTSEASKALQALGIQTQDANGNLRDVPTILSEMNQAMASLGSATKQEMTAAIFGLEAASGATVLLGQAGSGQLQKYTESLYQTGSASRVAAKQNDTAMGAMRRLSSAAESIAITMGNIFLPTLASGADKLAGLVAIADSFSQNFPTVTAVIVGGTAALIALKIATIAGGYAFTFMKGAVLQVVKIVQMARTAWLLYTGAMVASTTTSKTAIIVSKAMAAAQWLVNAATAAFPGTWIVAAIVGVIAAGVALYKNLDVVSEYGAKAWAAIKNFGVIALDGLKTAIINFTPLGWFMQAFGLANGWLSNFSLFESGSKIMQTLGQGILSAASSVISSVKSVFSKVREYLPFSDAKVGPFSELTKSGAAIMGTLADGVNSTNALESSMSNQLGSAGRGGISSLNQNMGRSSGSSSKGGDITVTISNITIGGDSQLSQSDVRKGVAQGSQDIVKEIQRAMKREERLSYG
ncbi:tail length tape-measure protein [Vibrio phage phi 2]|nr:tail length tape-measure protein [Vibrio phage phi 2]